MSFFLKPLSFVVLALLLQANPAQPGLSQSQTSAPSTSPFADAQHLLELGKYAEAISDLEAMKNQVPPPKGLARELGVAYYKKSDYPSAIANLQNALKEDPTDGESTQLMGLSLYLANRHAEAIPYLEKVQSWYPRANVDAAYILGMAYAQTNQFPKAREAFARMFAVPPDSAAAYLFCARMLLRLDFVPVAEEYGVKAAALDPKLPMAHYLLGELYLSAAKLDLAVSQFQQELAINPSSPNVYYKLGDAYLRAEKFDDAERLLQRSIWLDPNSTGPFILLGKVLMKKGEPELAARSLQRAIAMDPGNPMAHQLLGQTYRALGQTADAERELRQAADLNRKPTKP